MSDFDLYLGHTQAPTSSVREYDPNTTHPFISNDWIVAHNGVLTNCSEIKLKIAKDKEYSSVDTSLIPSLIDTFFERTQDEVESIIESLSLIKGTFGLWIHNKSSQNTYIARSGSTLYGDILTCDFSSVQLRGMKMLSEGVLYLLTKEGITEVGDFDSNSPFLVI
jgi:glucosamine 6-phosphate synthetase-like amidotransferase/phosphosugar isomerase protein